MEQQINKRTNKQVDKPSKNSSNIGLFIVVGVIDFILIIGVGVGVYFWQEGQKNELSMEVNILQNQITALQKQMSDLQGPKTQIPKPSPELPTDTPVNPPEELEKEPPIVKISGEIMWNLPQEIPSLKFFKESGYREDGAKYYKVGEFTGGYPKKGDVILVSAWYEGPAFYPGFYRFVKDEETGEIILLEKYSDELYQEDGLDRERFSIDKTYTIPSLEFPDTLSGSELRQILKLDKGVNEFFKLQGLKKVFADKNLGDVYTTDGYPLSFSNIFSRHGFYIKAPDGTVVIYSLEIDFIGEDMVPEITWDDGTKNTDEYVSTDLTGCGSSNYISVISKEDVDWSKDLKPAGMNSKGDIIYELKDQNHPLIKDFYENEYITIEGEKLSYEEFLAGRPLFFWVDPFERLIKFQSNKFLPPVECAKPVIYLYPEKTQEISVKIEPKGGLTYSEPNYGIGWVVKADVEGNITDLRSGKIYPYLFWEGRGAIYEQPRKGFVVKREGVHNFLLEKLEKLGLNKKETADFLEFWESKMKSSPYYFITFLGDREMEKIAPLTIDPKPDTVIRILMDFSPLDKPIETEGYEIKTPQRDGFTVVEWGGVLR